MLDPNQQCIGFTSEQKHVDLIDGLGDSFDLFLRVFESGDKAAVVNLLISFGEEMMPILVAAADALASKGVNGGGMGLINTFGRTAQEIRVNLGKLSFLSIIATAVQSDHECSRMAVDRINADDMVHEAMSLAILEGLGIFRGVRDAMVNSTPLGASVRSGFPNAFPLKGGGSPSQTEMPHVLTL